MIVETLAAFLAVEAGLKLCAIRKARPAGLPLLGWQDGKVFTNGCNEWQAFKCRLRSDSLWKLEFRGAFTLIWQLVRGTAKTWCEGHAIAQKVSLGAPPDQLSPDGQNWDLAAFTPTELREKNTPRCE